MDKYPTHYSYISDITKETSDYINFFKNNHSISSYFLQLFLEESVSAQISHYTKFTACFISPSHYPLIEGVKEVTPWEEIFNINPSIIIDDYDWFKNKFIDILEKEILKLKDTNNLLLLSDGLDSTLLLFLLVKNNIKFDAVHLVNTVGSESKIKLLSTHSKQFKYNLDFEFVENYDILDTRAKCLTIGPTLSMWGYIPEYYFGSIILSDKYKKYDTVITGLSSEISLQQTAVVPYLLDYNFNDLNKEYGRYVTYTTNKTGKEYLKTLFPNKKYLFFHNICGIRQANRIQKLCNKKFKCLYANSDLSNLVFSLSDRVFLKHLYKLPQLEVLEKEGFWHGGVKNLFNYQNDNFPFKVTNDIKNYYGVPENTFTSWLLIDFIDWYLYFNKGISPNNFKKDKSYYKKVINRVNLNQKIPRSKNFIKETIHKINDRL